jgi:hypothetical protein
MTGDWLRPISAFSVSERVTLMIITILVALLITGLCISRTLSKGVSFRQSLFHAALKSGEACPACGWNTISGPMVGRPTGFDDTGKHWESPPIKPLSHAQHAARVGLAVPCSAWDSNFGGGCLNCGWLPTSQLDMPVSKCESQNDTPRLSVRRRSGWFD